MQTEEFINIIKSKQKENHLPSQITFELTPLCNFNCKMCYVHLTRDEQIQRHELITKEQWIQLMEQAKSAGVLFLGFTGGEVFTRSDFRELYETAYNMGFFISLISNGFLISESVIKWLSKSKPYNIKITLYGASDETYKKVCGIDNGFTIVSNNIKKIKDAGISVITCMTVIHDNLDDVNKVSEWTRENKIHFRYTKLVKNPVRGAKRNVATVRVDPLDAYQKNDNNINIKHCIPLYPNRDNNPFSSCKNYRQSCVITWEGRMICCNFLNSISESVFDDTLVNCFCRLWERLDVLQQPKKCTTCKLLQFCNPCPGALEGETGSPEKTTQYICDLAKGKYFYMKSIQERNNKSNTIEIECE